MNFTNITPTATADTVDLVDDTYLGAMKGGSATQRSNVIEVMMTGLASASAPSIMLLARDSQVATGANTFAAAVGMDVPLDAATAALAAPVLTGNRWATLKPRRDTAAHLLNLAFNAFGGIVRWLAAPGEEVSMVGNAASLGELSLSALTGGAPGAMGAHVIYETL